jgi:hypothetical protein
MFQFLGKLISRAFLLLLLIVLLMQLPLKGKSIMNHYMDTTDNKLFHTVGNFINGFKKGFKRNSINLTKPEKINVDNIIPTTELTNKFLLHEEKRDSKKKAKRDRKLIQSRVPKKLTPPHTQGEYFSAEDEKRLKEILLSE